MSEKIVQLNEEMIKGQIRELVRGSVEETLLLVLMCPSILTCLRQRGGDADLLRSPRRAPDAHPHQQRDRAAEP